MKHEPLTARGELIHGMTGAQRVEVERSAAWAYLLNGGGGVISYFDGYAWEKRVHR